MGRKPPLAIASHAASLTKTEKIAPHLIPFYITFLTQPKQLVIVPLPFIWSPEDEFRREYVRANLL